MKVNLELRTKTPSTYRAAKVLGLYDIGRTDEQVTRIEADLPLEDREWGIGAIVGASGSGKSTIINTLWPEAVTASSTHEWAEPCLLDDFPEDLTPDQIIGLLTSVGFSSAPAWLRPHRVLSEGQKFRADVARSLATGLAQPLSESAAQSDPVVIDEFTSVVDRTVAKAVSVAVAKHARRTKQQLIVASCHKDILEWLTPDWYYDTDVAKFTWGSLQRPQIAVEVREGARSAWSLFHQHHYLNATLANSSRVFLGYVRAGDDDERLAAFLGLMPCAGHKGWWRAHRLVVLPDFQGLGIGNKFQEAIAETLWTKERKRYRVTTSAPGLLHYARKHSDIWRLAMAPKMKPAIGKTTGLKRAGKQQPQTSAGRLTCTLVYIPTELRKP